MRRTQRGQGIDECAENAVRAGHGREQESRDAGCEPRHGTRPMSALARAEDTQRDERQKRHTDRAKHELDGKHRGILAHMTLTFSRRLALTFGVLLPIVETIRRWHQLGDLRIWPAWLDDILLGACLLYGAWRTAQDARPAVRGWSRPGASFAAWLTRVSSASCSAWIRPIPPRCRPPGSSASRESDSCWAFLPWPPACGTLLFIRNRAKA